MILRRLEGSRFSEVLPLWGGLTAVIIGGGPSLTPEQIAIVGEMRATSEIRVIAVNDAYLLAPCADICYAADSHWFKWQEQGVEKPGFTAQQVRARWASFAGQKCTIETSGGNVTDPVVHTLRQAGDKGLSLDPQRLVTGRNSGFQSLNLAILAGSKRVILLGMDGKPAEDGKAHWFGDHPRPTPEGVYPLYRGAMRAARDAIRAAGVTVLNATPGSAIDAFERADLGALRG